MKAAIIISAVVLFFAALGMIPISINVAAAGKGKDFRVLVLFRVLHIRVHSIAAGGAKKAEAADTPTEQTEEKTSAKKKKKAKKSAEKEKKSIGDIVELVKLLIEIAKKVLAKTWRYIRIRVDCYDITVGTDDAAKTALLYGGVSQATAYLLTLLDETAKFRVKRKAPVNVGVDFLAGETKARVEMDFRIRLWQIISIGLCAGITYLRGMKKAKSEERDRRKDKSEDENKNAKADTNIKESNSDKNFGKAE